MYRSLGRALFELAGMALSPRARLAERVSIDERALSLLERGRGVVVATAHTGNWDLLACAAAEKVPLTVVTKRLGVRLLDRLWQRARARRGVRLVGAGRVAQDAGVALARGEVVAMMIDQAPERERGVVAAMFMGQRASVDLAPALLAMRARAPICAVFARRLPDGRHAGELFGVIEPPARPSRAWAEAAMKTLTAWLEEFVRAEPEQWLWMHRRWKGARDSLPAECPPASPTVASP
jgi:Kdo2-lipid IVA lauroyltransferase/acyltransferase